MDNRFSQVRESDSWISPYLISIRLESDRIQSNYIREGDGITYLEHTKSIGAGILFFHKLTEKMMFYFPEPSDSYLTELKIIKLE